MRNKKPRVKVGDIVAVRFIDHCAGGDDIIEFWVYGRVAVVKRESYAIDAWALADPTADRSHHRDNVETFNIARGVIKELIHLVPKPPEEITPDT